MSMKPSDDSRLYSYADYLNWDEDERVELIDGLPYLMVPAPSRRHQQVLLALGSQMYFLLKGHKCEVNIAPFDVRLPDNVNDADDKTYTVVQPDLVVVCDTKKLDERGCLGAPDLIVEVISPATASHDLIRKMSLYEKHQVKEYWIVHPIDQIVMVYRLNNGKYERPDVYANDRIIPSNVIQGLEIDLKEVFK